RNEPSPTCFSLYVWTGLTDSSRLRDVRPADLGQPSQGQGRQERQAPEDAANHGDPSLLRVAPLTRSKRGNLPAPNPCRRANWSKGFYSRHVQRFAEVGMISCWAASPAAAAMSVRQCLPSKRMRSADSYARRRASPSVAAVAVTASTRPPAVSHRDPSRRVPAW